MRVPSVPSVKPDSEPWSSLLMRGCYFMSLLEARPPPDYARCMSDSAQGHAHPAIAPGSHAHGPARTGEQRRLFLALGVAVVAMVAEALGGWYSNSLALLSDAGHMLADAGAIGL